MMKKRLAARVLMLVALAFTACLKKGTAVDPEPGPEENQFAETLDELQIRSFKILPEENPGIYGDVVCAASEDGLVWRGEIRSYKADLSALVPRFETNAARVTASGREQQSGVSAADFSREVAYRFYTTGGEYRELRVTIENPADSYTGFPVVAVVTKDRKGVTSKEEWVEGTMSIDKQAGECDEFYGPIQIKGRGHNSWTKNKKPYTVKLSSKASILGMSPHKRWVLLANAVDRTLLRNKTAFEIARRTGLPWTPGSRFVDLILNGKFCGSYLLCEQIRVDKKRVNIAEMTADMTSGDDLTGGYLLEVDRYYDEVNKFRSQYRDLPVNISSPDEEVLNQQQLRYITDYVANIERLLYDGAQVDPAYADFLDLDTFIDWWVVIELTHNRDARLPGSCYMYKDRLGKLCAGPVWDFDLTTFIQSTGFLLKDYETDNAVDKERSLWYNKLFSDPAFRARVKERWALYKEKLARIPDFVDAEAANLRVSAESNWKIWSLGSGSNRDENLSWEEAVALLKANYTARLQWMDGEIGKL